MIHNDLLVRAIIDDLRREAARPRLQRNDRADIRRAIGRWLESLGRRIQGPAQAASSC